MSPQAPLSTYIHIPFCETRCSYCAFNVYTDLESLIPAYIRALRQEIQVASANNPHREIHTVYFGGGTPSLLAARHYRDILHCLAKRFSLAVDLEVSIEANPNDISTAYLRELREAGINRLSVGMQSASGRVLRLFERRHDLDAVEYAVRCARQAGFDNVNLDVIFGSPGESLAEWKPTVDAILGYAPEHVSMYGLELKGGTSLRAQVDAGALPRPDDDNFADLYEFASRRLAGDGYAQYEISNWTRPQFECRHNLQYWRNLPYLGFGAGAHGFAGGVRYSNIANPVRYVESLNKRSGAEYDFPLTPAVAKSTKVNSREDLYETVMMSIRLTREGIHRPTFRRRFGVDIADKFSVGIGKMQTLGLIHVERDRVRLSERGRLLSNAVIRELV
ncbi:MAG: radical SAM family heme chaperone HemW [Chloroflexi bacterium]|nr:radical SAM family heme chaperone HemW [Chloroflexota bacterium]